VTLPALHRVFKHSRSRGRDRLVLGAIASFAGPDDTAWPSHASIAERATVSVATVRRAIKRASDLGELAVVSKGGPLGCNLYTVTVGLGGQPPAHPDEQVHDTAGGADSAPAHLGEVPAHFGEVLAHLAPSPAHLDEQRSTNRSTTTKEPIEVPVENASFSKSPDLPSSRSLRAVTALRDEQPATKEDDESLSADEEALARTKGAPCSQCSQWAWSAQLEDGACRDCRVAS